MSRMTMVAAALVLVAGTAAWAQPWDRPGAGSDGFGRMEGPGAGPMMPGEEPGMEGMGPVQGIMRLLDRLDLTDAQWTEVERIIEDAREEIRAVVEASEPVEPVMDFLEVFSRSSVTARDFEALAEEREAVREEIRGIGLEALVRVHDVLTRDQLDRIAEFLESGLPGPGGMHGPLGGGLRGGR